MSAERRFFCIAWLVSWLTLSLVFLLMRMNEAEALFAAFPMGWTAAIWMTRHREKLAAVWRHPIVRGSLQLCYPLFSILNLFRRALEKKHALPIIFTSMLLCCFAVMCLILLINYVRKARLKKAGLNTP